MNEMINCIKLDRMQSFHRYYRSADALLVDDIQILGGKDRTRKSSSTPSTNCLNIRSRS